MIDNITGFHVAFSPLRQFHYLQTDITGVYPAFIELIADKIAQDLNLKTNDIEIVSSELVKTLYKYKNDYGNIQLISFNLRNIKELPSLKYIYDKNSPDEFVKKEVLLYLVNKGLELIFPNQYSRTFLLYNFLNEVVLNIQFTDKEYKPYENVFEYNGDSDSVNNILIHNYLINEGYKTLDPDKGLIGRSDVFRMKYNNIIKELLAAFNYKLSKNEAIREFSEFFFTIADQNNNLYLIIDSDFAKKYKIPFLNQNNFFTKAFAGNKIYSIEKQIIEYLIWFGDSEEFYLNNMFYLNGTEEPYIELLVDEDKFQISHAESFIPSYDDEDDYEYEEDDEDNSLYTMQRKYQEERLKEHRRREEEEEEERRRQEFIDDTLFLMLLEEEDEDW